MIQYDQIIYYDSDFVFLRNPISVIAECANATFPRSIVPPVSTRDMDSRDSRMVENGHKSLCAVVDNGIGGDYFNSGFFLLRPNMTTFTDLLAHRGWGDNTGLWFIHDLLIDC